mgnify:CR=1 FL=1
MRISHLVRGYTLGFSFRGGYTSDDITEIYTDTKAGLTFKLKTRIKTQRIIRVVLKIEILRVTAEMPVQ